MTRPDSLIAKMGIMKHAKFLMETIHLVQARVYEAGGDNRDLNYVLQDLFCHHTGRSLDPNCDIDRVAKLVAESVESDVRKAFKINGISERINRDQYTAADPLQAADALRDFLGRAVEELKAQGVDVDVTNVNPSDEVLHGTESVRPVDIPEDLQEVFRGASGFGITPKGRDKT